MAKAFDAIVVGGAFAGSPTAMLLARKGYRVLLVDRATFPSDTVSTHLVHPLGARRCRDGDCSTLAASGCPPIDTYAFDFGPFTISGAPGTTDAPVAYGPRRTVLDKVLVDAAAEAGAEVREGFSVEILIEDGRVVGITGRSQRQSITEHARVVIGADGRHSSWRRRSGPSSTTRSRRCSPPTTPTGAACRWTADSKPTSAPHGDGAGPTTMI